MPSSKKLKSRCCKKFAKKAKACSACPLKARLAPEEFRELKQKAKKKGKKAKGRAKKG